MHRYSTAKVIQYSARLLIAVLLSSTMTTGCLRGKQAHRPLPLNGDAEDSTVLALDKVRGWCIRAVECKSLGTDHSALEGIEGDPVVSVGFHRDTVTDEDLKLLAPLKHLRTLYLSRSKVTDIGLNALTDLHELRELHLDDTQVTDAGLKNLLPLGELRQLHLPGTSITDAGLAALVELPKIRQLSVYSTGITDAGLRHLSRMREMQELQLGGTNITNEGMKELGSMAGLKRLSLASTQITDAGLRELRSLKLLQDVDLGYLTVSGDALKELAVLTQLQKLNLRNTPLSLESFFDGDDQRVFALSGKRFRSLWRTSPSHGARQPQTRNEGNPERLPSPASVTRVKRRSRISSLVSFFI
jgi:Leucine Rich repeat